VLLFLPGGYATYVYFNNGTIRTLSIVMNFPILPVERIGIGAWQDSRAHATRNCASPIPVCCWALIRETRQGKDHREGSISAWRKRTAFTLLQYSIRASFAVPSSSPPSPMPPFLTHRRSKAPGDNNNNNSENDNDKPL
jgi:hypothetical protein